MRQVFSPVFTTPWRYRRVAGVVIAGVAVAASGCGMDSAVTSQSAARHGKTATEADSGHSSEAGSVLGQGTVVNAAAYAAMMAAGRTPVTQPHHHRRNARADAEYPDSLTEYLSTHDNVVAGMADFTSCLAEAGFPAADEQQFASRYSLDGTGIPADVSRPEQADLEQAAGAVKEKCLTPLIGVVDAQYDALLAEAGLEADDTDPPTLLPYPWFDPAAWGRPHPTDKYEYADLECADPGDPPPNFPATQTEDDVVRALRANDKEALAAAATPETMQGAHREWIGHYLANEGCWALLETAYDHGLPYTIPEAEGVTVPLSAAYHSGSPDIVAMVLRGVAASPTLTETEKHEHMIDQLVGWGNATAPMVKVNYPYNIDDLTPYPDTQDTAISQAAEYHRADDLSVMMDRVRDRAPDNLLALAIMSVHVPTTNDDMFAPTPEKVHEVVRTVKVLRAYGYDPTTTVDVSHHRDDVTVVTPLEYARAAHLNDDIITALS